ncbi:MAG: glycosyltransferase family 39 protein [Myxococcales bacterium]|nr:glycosyltransferase family 39 protein [Myxococcales bacterium]
MPRFLRVYLLGCLAIAFAYLVLHVREPLRLNFGDPSADAGILSSIAEVERYGFFESSAPGMIDVGPQPADGYHAVHYPPLADVFYGATGKYLGVRAIGTLRLFALAFSVLAMLLLYHYARRMWTEPIALLATALFSTSVLWMMYADSIQQAPLTQAAAFLSLWGLVRVMETRRRAHYAAAFFGALACFLASYDYWLFLPAAVLFTIHVKRGNPLAAGNLRFVAICAAACLVALLAKYLFVSGVLLDRKASMLFPTLLRRATFVFTPMFWVTCGCTIWRAMRAPSLRAVLEDGVTWMLVTGAVTIYLFAQRAASQMIGVQALLPFYAIGSSIVISRLLEGRRLLRVVAIGWVALAPAWSGYFLLSQPREVLDRDDVAKVNAYLAASDRNDFVISNLLAEAPLRAMFERHSWPASDKADPKLAYRSMLDVFEAAGTDYVHAVIFTSPETRFVDRSLWPLAAPRRLWSVTGWPYLQRRKANEIVREYDRKVLRNLELVHAKVVLHLANFDVYRIERSAVLEAAGAGVPVVRTIDFGNVASAKHKLLGWSEPRLTDDGSLGVAVIDGFAPCANPEMERQPNEPGGNACRTVLTRWGLRVMDEGRSDRAQLMIRVERACDLRLTIEFSAPALVGLSLNEFASSQCAPATRATFDIPQASVRAGINVLVLERRYGPKSSKAEISSLTVDPVCGL